MDKGNDNGGAGKPASGEVTAQPTTGAAAAAPGRKAAARFERYTQDFTQAVTVLARDAGYKNLRLADLEWLVVPPLLVGQVRIALTRATPEAPLVPSAVALWARVSAEVDKRLTENLDKPPLLGLREWNSGDIIWLITLAGEAKALATLVPQLQQTVFKDRPVKIRVQDKAGKTIVQVMPPPAAKA
ncbi:MAG: toxin-activating lysine-acyltransferase [Hyphomicrobiaceae bacterium]